MSLIVDKELKGGTLIKIYHNGEPSIDIKQEINKISMKILSYKTENLKIVFDYEDHGTINFFEGHDGKKPFMVLSVNSIGNVPDICHSYEIAQKALSLLTTDIDFEIAEHLIKSKIK